MVGPPYQSLILFNVVRAHVPLVLVLDLRPRLNELTSDKHQVRSFILPKEIHVNQSIQRALWHCTSTI